MTSSAVRFAKLVPAAAITLGLSVAGTGARAQQALTITTFGGAFENAVDKAIFQPFTAKSHIAINKEQYDGGLAKLRAMVEAKNTSWDVLDMETNDAIAGCDDGLLEKLPASTVSDPNDFLPGAIQPCAVAMMVWSTIFAYDTTKLKTAPTKIADLFDLGKFPGKRGLRKSPKVNLEWALLADGVPKDQVYAVLAKPEGVDRALKKLDTIKSQIVWWEAGSQPPQLLADGAVAMTQAYNGRIYDAQTKDKKPFQIVWDGQVYDFEFWGIPKNGKHTAEAQQFISYASQPEVISQLSNYIAYAPPSNSGVAKIPPAVMPNMPTAPANFGNAIKIDAAFWADHIDDINKRFGAWLAR